MERIIAPADSRKSDLSIVDAPYKSIILVFAQISKVNMKPATLTEVLLLIIPIIIPITEITIAATLFIMG